MAKGKLIVIDGSDGSGKATQTALLVKRLKKAGKKVRQISFPRYGETACWMVERYLNGKYGSADEVGPYTASLFYALDRYDASFTIKRWLEQGFIVIANRYVSSNKGHQLTKITEKAEREKFLRWVDETEYRLLNIPKEDAVIILYIPAAMAQRLVDKKGYRDYMKGNKRDIHEGSLTHLKRAEHTYKELTKRYSNWQLIECVENGRLLSKQDIAEKVWKTIKRRF